MHSQMVDLETPTPISTRIGLVQTNAAQLNGKLPTPSTLKMTTKDVSVTGLVKERLLAHSMYVKSLDVKKKNNNKKRSSRKRSNRKRSKKSKKSRTKKIKTTKKNKINKKMKLNFHLVLLKFN